MPIIASHHLPGGWRSTGANAYAPQCAWPDDCYVQWGASGLVMTANGNYCTAFFEAFPTDPQTFIRGEGKTLADAEGSAFRQWQRFAGCAGHEFERRHYRNGAGFCKHCGLFKSQAFEPLERCEVCGAPTYHSYGVDADGVQHWYCEAHQHLRDPKLHPSPVDRLREIMEEDSSEPADDKG